MAQSGEGGCSPVCVGATDLLTLDIYSLPLTISPFADPFHSLSLCVGVITNRWLRSGVIIIFLFLFSNWINDERDFMFLLVI